MIPIRPKNNIEFELSQLHPFLNQSITHLWFYINANHRADGSIFLRGRRVEERDQRRSHQFYEFRKEDASHNLWNMDDKIVNNKCSRHLID